MTCRGQAPWEKRENMNRMQELAIERPVGTLEVPTPTVQCEREADIAAGFEGYRSFFMKEGEKLTKGNMQKNHIVVLLDGRAGYALDGRQNVLQKGEMILVASSETFSMRCDTDCHVLMHTFGALSATVSDYLTQLYRSCPFYTGQGDVALRLTDVLEDFASAMCRLIDKGLMNSWFTQQKANEGFHLIFHSYSDVDVLGFFRRLICREQYFRNIVLKYCDEVKNIDELVERSGMCRTNFYKQFNREFGMSVHRWMQLRRARAVRESAARPMMTVRKLMQLHHFSSPSNFIRFCRLYFGCTPNELIRSVRIGVPVRGGELQALESC